MLSLGEKLNDTRAREMYLSVLGHDANMINASFLNSFSMRCMSYLSIWVDSRFVSNEARKYTSLKDDDDKILLLISIKNSFKKYLTTCHCYSRERRWDR